MSFRLSIILSYGLIFCGVSTEIEVREDQCEGPAGSERTFFIGQFHHVNATFQVCVQVHSFVLVKPQLNDVIFIFTPGYSSSGSSSTHDEDKFIQL